MSANVALIIAGVGAAGTAGALVVAILAHRRSGQAQEAANRSAGAAERSAAASEESARVAQADLEMRRRQTAAELVLVIGSVGGGVGASQLKFELVNHGGSSARKVRPRELLVHDVYFNCGGEAEVIPPGGSASFRGDGPPGGIAGELNRAKATAVTYVDELGPHTVELNWRRS